MNRAKTSALVRELADARVMISPANETLHRSLTEYERIVEQIESAISELSVVVRQTDFVEGEENRDMALLAMVEAVSTIGVSYAEHLVLMADRLRDQIIEIRELARGGLTVQDTAR